MIRTRKYKKQWTESKSYGIRLDVFNGTYTLDFYFGHHIFVVYRRRD